MARGRPAEAQLGIGSAPSGKQTGTPPCLCRREASSAPRRRRGVASAGGTPTRATGLSLRSLADTASRVRTASAPRDTPRDAAVTSSRPQGAEGPRAKGEGSVRTAKPAPSEYPHATALAETKPARFASGLGVDPPEGWVDWVWLLVIRRGGCAKEMKRAELALNEERRHRVVCFHCYKSPEQEAKSQQIVGQSLLSCLQYPVPYLSRLQRIYPSQHSKLRWSMMLGRSLS